jgi:hypothetical protein
MAEVLWACAVLSLLAAGSARADLESVFVFDGSPDAGDIFVVNPFTGLEFDRGEGGFTCPGTSHVSGTGVAPGGPVSAVVEPLGVGLNDEARNFLLSRPALLALNMEFHVAALEDDCDVLAVLADVQAYVAGQVASVNPKWASIDACVAQAEQAYCDKIAAIEQAQVLPGSNQSAGRSLIWLYPRFRDSYVLGPDYFYECTRYTRLILYMSQDPGVHDALDLTLAECQQALAGIGTFDRNTIYEDEIAPMLVRADAYLEKAHTALAYATDYQNIVINWAASFDAVGIQYSCDFCEDLAEWGLDSDGNQQNPRNPDFLDLEWGYEGIAGIANSFQQAALDVEDTVLASRYGSIAAKLASLPPSRIFHASFPASTAVGSVSVALRNSALPDDGTSPLAVVLTARVDTSAQPTLLDVRIVLDALRLFGRTLASSAASPPNPEDLDSDGVRDSFENGTGVFVSRVDTGTDATLRDTDGDLYSDAIEIAAGSDPNLFTSIPSRLGLSLPALGGFALAVLVGLLAGLGMRRRVR